MQAFRFRLERILGWRRTELAAEEARMAPLVMERNRLEAARIEVAAARDRTRRELLASAFFEGRDLVAHAAFRTRLAKEQEALARKAAECRERMAAQRVRIIEAQRKVKALEKLKHRRLHEWRTQLNRELESFAAEAYLARWSGR
ncbi:MAG TPA: hypothetical protein VJN43_02895 [Bryobacteraceae bacterium]|nr:hypothetical protein [Bryobacteraceae bacterium]